MSYEHTFSGMRESIRRRRELNVLPGMQEWYRKHVLDHPEPHEKAIATMDARQAECDELTAAFAEAGPPQWREMSATDYAAIQAALDVVKHKSHLRFLCTVYEQGRTDWSSNPPMKPDARISLKQSLYLWMIVVWNKKKSRALRELWDQRRAKLMELAEGLDWRDNHEYPEDYYAL